MLFQHKEYRSYARRAGDDALQIYVQQSRRHQLEVLNPTGQVISRASVRPDLDCRIIYLLEPGQTASTLRIISARQEVQTVEVEEAG